MDEIEVFLQGEGIPKVVIMKVPQGGTVQDVLTAAAAQMSMAQGQEYFVFLEDGDEILSLSATLEACGIRHHGQVHIHRCRRVEVTVNFNGQTKELQFAPAATIQRIKKWAANKFELSEPDALEHTLQLCQSTDRPADTVHVGTLVAHGQCAVCFDLVPKHRVEG